MIFLMQLDTVVNSFEQIHGGFHKCDSNTRECSGNKGLRKRKNLSMPDNLFHLSIRKELDSVEDHVTYTSRIHTQIPQRGDTNPL